MSYTLVKVAHVEKLMSCPNITSYWCIDPDHDLAHFAPNSTSTPYSAGRQTRGVGQTWRFFASQTPLSRISCSWTTDPKVIFDSSFWVTYQLYEMWRVAPASAL